MPTPLTNRFHQSQTTLAITRLPSAIFRHIPGPDARPRLHPVSAIAPIRHSSSESSRPQPPRRGSPSLPPVTPAIPSRRISWKTGMTSEPFRSCLVTET